MTVTLSFLERVQQIAEALLEAERGEPVAPPREPSEMARHIAVGPLDDDDTAGRTGLTCMAGVAPGRKGLAIEDVLDALERVALATPRTGTRRFFNQLFSGRIDAAAAGEMIASLLNTSMYTYKVAGPHALIETALTQHMARHIGFAHNEGEGVFSPGGSLANLAAMLVARNQAVPDAREHGLDGRRLTMYGSADCHYSIRKNAGMIGLGRRNLRMVDCDERGRMRPDALEAMIVGDRQAGALPVGVIATAGTTVLGAFDPIEPIADVAQRQGVWLHVDGALGGTVLLSRRFRHLVAGSQRADSWTWDAHKLMGVPLSSSVVLVRERGLLEKHFSEAAAYLFHNAETELDHGVRSIQCGRRNDALKLWASWKHFGDEGYAQRVEHLFDLARHAADEIESRPGLVLTCRPESVNVCFEVRGKPSEAICQALRVEQLAMVGHAEVGGRRIIRVACVNADMTTADIDAFLDAVEDVARHVRDGDNAL
ncbi:MAG: hypothetical protein DYG94_08690 [Leptolyngbya sp. PLA3]|nr:MAG: hypothetical protein EDM82_03105 [Cyanobacteria bacterium CYA]MCE7968807.1 hypothetical protein [Leptolyngbya sp. PL-A3]